jgi:putative oxidoreductase
MYATTQATTDLRADPVRKGGLLSRVVSISGWLIRGLNEYLAPVGDLAIRLWVANVFWTSGLTKAQSFSTTLQLFKYEYQVPLLSPEVAAYLSTFLEISFSALLAIGLAGRFSAAALTVLNIVAVISYPALEEVGLIQHQLWGLLLLVPLLHGPGKLSLDYWIARKLGV